MLAALLLALERPPVGADVILRKDAPPLQSYVTVIYLEKGVRYVQETYFVDVQALRAAYARGRKGPALELLRSGAVPSGARMTFLVDISRAKRGALVERSLRQAWPGGNYSRDLPEVKAYLDWQSHALNQGDQVEYVFQAGSGMSIRFGQEPPKRFYSPPLCQALRTVEYSDDPETPDMMKKLEDGLQALLH
jgi:hypothetical protein